MGTTWFCKFYVSFYIGTKISTRIKTLDEKVWLVLIADL